MSAKIIFSKNMVLLFCTMLLFFLTESSINSVFPVIISEKMHYDRSYVGLFIGIFSVTAMIIKFFSGYLSDRFGRVRILIPSLLCCALCAGLFGIATAFTMIILIRLLHGVGSGLVRAISPALTVDIASQHHAGKGLGFIGLTSVLAMVVASPASFYILDNYSSRTLFIILTVMGAASVLPVLTANVTQVRLPSHKLKSPLGFIETTVLPLALLKFISSISHGLFMSFSIIYARDSGLANAGAVLAVYALGNSVMRLLAGYTIDRAGPGVIAWTAYAFCMSGYYVFANYHVPWQMLSGVLMIGFGAGIENTMLPSMASKIVDKKFLGRANSTLECAFSAGIVTGAVICGKITEAVPLDDLFESVSFMGVISLVLFYGVIIKGYRKRIVLDCG